MMYINDIHILWYFVVGILGLFVGYFVQWCNMRLPEYKKVFCKDFITTFAKCGKPSYILMILNAVLYIAALYFAPSWFQAIKYLCLVPMLLIAFCIDYKHCIIPNRLTLTMFELGLVFAFVEGMVSINFAIDRFLGVLVGGGIFLGITLLGGLILGKEAMGLGDVKIMGALGLFFGWRMMLIVSLLAFLIGAVISVILLLTKVKKTDEYIPFGPFIVIATFMVMYIPFQYLVYGLLKIFTLGMFH